MQSPSLKKLNERSLKIGDIVLTSNTSPVSKMIQAATKDDVSHVMICVEEYSVIDAMPEGVHARNTQRLLFDNESTIHVLRYRDGLAEEQVRSICAFVRERVGTQYSVKEAVRAGLGGAGKWTNKQFCSRLAAQAYASAGIKLVDDPNYCSPSDVKNSRLLLEVENAAVSITAEEAAAWNDYPDATQMMRDVTNAVLDGVRVKNEAVQSFSDLHVHLIEHPEDDDYVLGCIRSSGYLDLWRIDVADNPWHYDTGLMDGISNVESVEEYCWTTLSSDGAGPHRYVANRGGYVRLSRQFRLRTFEAMKNLYDQLAALHQRRIEVAAEWLAAHGYLDLPQVPCLRPHTSEWFAALEVWDPYQASHTREIIRMAGSRDVCSVCGDFPATAYRLEACHRPPSGVDTLRLCDDCLAIRKRDGEPFVPLTP